jgi:dolichol-phosphate mannosyltransferase
MLLSRIEKAVEGILTEVLFVDDSTDDTPQAIMRLAPEYPSIQVRLLHRPAEERTGGLGGAVVAGMRLAGAPLIIVMDGDLQHPPELIPQMFAKAGSGPYDLVVASRRVAESDARSLGLVRNLISRGLDLIARVLFPRELKGVSDPLTGFFLVRNAAIDLDVLNPQGFKILLEILVRNPNMRKAELPFHFGERFAGKSKASSKEAFKYLKLLARLRFGENVLHFTKFGMVGLTGILVNTAVLAFFTDVFKIHYLVSSVFATVGSTTWNFFLTEYWVFGSRKQGDGRLRRYALFFVMNNLALLFRGPIMFVLTSWLGVYYLLSNLISLAALTVVRYFLADNWIWGKSKVDKDSVQPLS